MLPVDRFATDMVIAMSVVNVNVKTDTLELTAHAALSNTLAPLMKMDSFAEVMVLAYILLIVVVFVSVRQTLLLLDTSTVEIAVTVVQMVAPLLVVFVVMATLMSVLSVVFANVLRAIILLELLTVLVKLIPAPVLTELSATLLMVLVDAMVFASVRRDGTITVFSVTLL